jgi:uncharacterized repeat protein (TIGR03803 family)
MFISSSFVSAASEEGGNSMRQKKFWFTVSEILAVLAVVLMLSAGAGAASKYKLLHRFNGGRADGASPYAGLVFDAAGNLYGTTISGGSAKFHAGTVIKLTPNSDGSWTERVLYSFTRGADGAYPHASLIFDAAGNIYGTTAAGGTRHSGVVFKLTSHPDGNWTESTLHTFTRGADGNQPLAGLIFDAVGNLYGTTVSGGDLTCNAPYGCGVVFKLSLNSDGSWTESVLHTFTGTDGQGPTGLIFDQAGNLYGTTVYGGASGYGAVFKLAPNADGSWRESVLHSFKGGYDGGSPFATLIFDQAGNLYGAATGFSASGHGTVFKLAPSSGGEWREHVLHRFSGGNDGWGPVGLIFDAAGNLYGTTELGGAYGYGVVFELMPTSTGWKERVLHAFTGTPAIYPTSGVTVDKARNLYGTTEEGHTCNGVVFEITP